MYKIKEKLNNDLKEFVNVLKKPEIRILPGNLAFFILLSIVPLITLVVFICSKLNITLDDISTIFEIILPSSVKELIVPNSNAPLNYSNAIFFLIIGFFVSSNGANAIIIACNEIYKIKLKKNYFKRRIKAIFLTIILMVLFILMLVILAFGNMIVEYITSLKIFEFLPTSFYSKFMLFKWPVSIVVIYILVKTIFLFSPDKKIGSKEVRKGAIFTTFGLILVTAIYAYYANNLAHYDIFYGGLSNIVVLMIWINMISYVLVIGIAINASSYDLD